MPIESKPYPKWLVQWMKAQGIALWGAADLKGFSTPPNPKTGKALPCAVAWVIPMNPDIMVGIQGGPNQPYADEYDR